MRSFSMVAVLQPRSRPDEVSLQRDANKQLRQHSETAGTMLPAVTEIGDGDQWWCCYELGAAFFCKLSQPMAKRCHRLFTY